MSDRPLGLLGTFTIEADALNRLSYIEMVDFGEINQNIVDKFDEVAVEIGDAWLNQNSPMKPIQMRKFIRLIERETKRFLSLRVLYPDSGERFVPTRLVDRMWHQLIVDTQLYCEFCNKAFGAYLHHIPTRRSASSIAEVAGNDFAVTKERLSGAYGALPALVWGRSAGCNQQGCMSACFD